MAGSDGDADAAAGTARLVWPAHDAAALDAAAQALAQGRIVGLPTETVYGLAVLPEPGPLAALIEAKQRPAEKGIALLIDGLDQAEQLVALPDAARALAAQFWPGPLTLVLSLRDGVSLPDEVTGGRRAVGLRLPDHVVPRLLARRLGPLAVSSANLSGQPDARTAQELEAGLGRSLAVILDDGPTRGGVPSSVVMVGADGSVTLLRAGAVAERDLHAALASPPA